jgi:hypothetical protein
MVSDPEEMFAVAGECVIECQFWARLRCWHERVLPPLHGSGPRQPKAPNLQRDGGPCRAAWGNQIDPVRSASHGITCLPTVTPMPTATAALLDTLDAELQRFAEALARVAMSWWTESSRAEGTHTQDVELSHAA